MNNTAFAALVLTRAGTALSALIQRPQADLLLWLQRNVAEVQQYSRFRCRAGTMPSEHPEAEMREILVLPCGYSINGHCMCR
jgi:hypothetical protein